MQYCKQRGIHLNGPKLGKPYADPAIQKQQKKLEWQESGERGEIERNFGVGKRRYGLDCIVTKLKETSEVMVHASVLFLLITERTERQFLNDFAWKRRVRDFFSMIINKKTDNLHAAERITG